MSSITKYSTYSTLILSILILQACSMIPKHSVTNPLKDKIICVDPGHGGTAGKDNFRIGPTGEREEWIDLRVALFLKEILEAKGAKVLLTRLKDDDVPLKDRALLAVNNNADVFVSIHHNATADRSVNVPIVYYHANASENQGSVQLGECLIRQLSKALHDDKNPVILCSDHTIFPESGTAVLRHSYGIPGVIGEASFFSNAPEEKRLKNYDYNHKEAEAYAKALEEFFSQKSRPILPKYSTGKVTPLTSLQEGKRMDAAAEHWREEYDEGLKLFSNGDPQSLDKAYECFTRCAVSFPDSPVSRDCHIYRSDILVKMGKTDEAVMEHKRAQEFFVPINLP